MAEHSETIRILRYGDADYPAGGGTMTINRAIEILTTDRRHDYSPQEYEKALAMAREALEGENAEQSH